MPIDDAWAETAHVLDQINRTHGASWRLVDRFTGGWQGGAYRVRDRTGTTAVLKWSADVSWAGQVIRAAAAVERIRDRGYPTPAWLLVGATADGYPYQLQQFVGGRPVERFECVLEPLVSLVESQAGLDPDPARNWSGYVMEVVFGEPAARLARSDDFGAAVVSAIERSCSGLEHVRPPADDLVHGDLSLDNVLMVDQQVVGVIDIEALGSGTRVFDYATLLRGAFGQRAADESIEVLVSAADAVSGREVLRLCAASAAIDLMLFVHDRDASLTPRHGPAVLRMIESL